MKMKTPEVLHRKSPSTLLWEELHRKAPPIRHPIPRLDRSIVPPARLESLQLLAARLAPRAVQESGSRAPGLLSACSKSRSNNLPIDKGGERARIWLSWLMLAVLVLSGGGCTLVTYTGPNGERFSRGCFGASTGLSALVLETDTNGVRRVELRGYSNDGSQALGIVTEAAVKAAIQNLK